MWTATPRFFATLARSHSQLVRIDVLHDGRLARRVDSTAAADPGTGQFVQSIGGTVNVARQTIRRDGSVTFLDTAGTLLPDEVDDLFAPMIAELRIFYGVRYWDATPAETAAGADVEYVPVGTLVVTDAVGPYPTLTVSGFDRLWFLADFAAPYPVAAGTPTHEALTNLLSAQIPAAHLALNIPQTEFRTGALLYEEQTSSADAAHAMALSMGMVLYADPMGVVTARAEPTTDDEPAMTYEPGALSTMLRPTRSISAGDARNAVVFTGESGEGVPFRGYAQDNDPASLTYVGRVGLRPAFQSSPLIRSAPQAEAAAKTALQRILGLSDTLVVPVVPNPCLESGDVLRVRDPQQGIDLAVIADAFGVPLRATDGEQTIQCRSRVIR